MKKISKTIYLLLLSCFLFLPTTEALADNKWQFPFDNLNNDTVFPIGQAFGYDGGFRQNSFHNGLDFGSINHPGNEIKAVQSGEVIFTGSAGAGYEALGTVIVIVNNGISMVYQEFGNNVKVKEGDVVRMGDVIATRTTDHLHLGITKKNWKEAQSSAFNDDGTWIDPEKILKGELSIEGLESISDEQNEISKEEPKIEVTKYVGEDAWKNKMIQFQTNSYTSTFKGIDTGSSGFINSAFISGLNTISQTILKFAYIGMMALTIALFLFMFTATVIYLVILPNGLGGYKLMDIFEKFTRLDSTINRTTTIELISRLLLTILIIACLYANILPILISGFIHLLLLFF